MQLAPNFYLSEFVKSQTALRQGIDNTPDEHTIETLERLAKELLQPVRNHFDATIVITSGFRCPVLNLAIGSKDTSQHIRGEAVDFEVVGRGNYEVALYIRDNMDFDQLILEFWRDDDPYAGWVHCSHVGKSWNRQQSLTISKGKTAYGLPGDPHG